MQHFMMPVCYFPSTVLFLDDSRDFLLNFVLQLDESLAYRIFDAPQKALQYIQNKRCEGEVIKKHCVNEYTAAQQAALRHQGMSDDLLAIHAEVYNPHRFSEISVVVVDYAMPGIDGLAFCRRIENNNIKKILLTGQADEKRAIEAFNEGLIHRYIKKSDLDAAEQITKSIAALQFQYFQSMSDMVMRLLGVSYPSNLSDAVFNRFFDSFREEHRITEYYLIDHSGSFFMLDDDAHPSFLIVKTEDDLQAYYATAKAHGVSDAVLQQIAAGKKIPDLTSTLSSNTKLTDASFLDAEALISDKIYYYAFVRNALPFDARQKKILSYHRYLEELDAEELLMR